MSFALLITFATRLMLVLLFLPFSALDKILNFKGAVGQAREIARPPLATILILIGLAVEIFCSLGVLTGFFDRLAGFILAGYCGVTALLWKQFWAPGDFWQGSDSRGRQLFWDFLKNFALAGGFLLVAAGPTRETARGFLAAPLSSTQPYASSSERSSSTVYR